MTKRKTRPVGKLKEEGARYISEGIDHLEAPMQTAKLFKNGRSQAVRLPKEFRFEGEEVYVRREGRSVVLSPKDEGKDHPWQDFFDALDMIEPGFVFERHQPTEQQVRKSSLFREPPRSKRKRSK